jgi:23S rRNA pseudouridine955/2504/2580 synthase
MAHAGWPLLGDGKYGREQVNRKYHESGQALYSWRIRFDFPTDAGILNGLKGKEFCLKKEDIPFVKKYFL